MEIKVGMELMAYDYELERFIKAEIISIYKNVVTLKDIDLTSGWYGQIWQDHLEKLNNKKFYKFNNQ